ncbi:MAG TPA: S-formylglutathione hydrolase [Polyangia bacterium]|jgi:S-formylglutathione hydrolase|nr:S-formylglutathione hydrolase [Polyangia bacterium]
MTGLVTKQEHRCFDGTQGFYEHQSAACGGPMRFAVYQPPAALRGERVPVLYYLAGLTCSDETFAIKSGAQRVAAELGLALVSCDTSPRATRFPGDDAADDFGLGAGFYLDATEAPWSTAYRMYTYLTRDLRAAVESNFPVDRGRRGIFGHSMGGHGALVIALRNPHDYRSVSAFAPVATPSEVPWGQKAFTGYLGAAREDWREWDATALVRAGRRFDGTILVDQGTADQFLAKQLRPELFEAACAAAGQPLELARRDGYDHGYFFVGSFMERHLRWHHESLTDERTAT